MRHIPDFISHKHYHVESVHKRCFSRSSQCFLLGVPGKDFYLNDGVHLNSVRQYQLYRSYRDAILRACFEYLLHFCIFTREYTAYLNF